MKMIADFTRVVRSIFGVSDRVMAIIVIPATLVGAYVSIEQGKDIYRKYFNASGLYADKFYFSGSSSLTFPGDAGVAAISSFFVNKEETAEPGTIELFVCSDSEKVTSKMFNFHRLPGQFSTFIVNNPNSSFRLIANIAIDDSSFYVSQEVTREGPLDPFNPVGERAIGNGSTVCQ